MATRARQVVSQAHHSGLSVERRRDMRRQRRSSPGPPTKAYPQRYIEEAERREGRRWQAGHGKLFHGQTTNALPPRRLFPPPGRLSRSGTGRRVR